MVRLWEKRGGPWAREGLCRARGWPRALWALALRARGVRGVCAVVHVHASCPAMGMSEKRRSRSGARENERGCVGGSEHGASGGAALVWR
eukprot:3867315-Prymnesium_polylepis.1